MRFTPDYTFRVFTDEQLPQAFETIDRTLDDLRHAGFVSAHDGKRIYYEYFLSAGDKGSVVISHGMSEFTRKYYEFTYYLLNLGYDVFLYDQRGHGLSDRLTDDPDVVHVERFDHYITDLHTVVEQVVRPNGTAPLYLFGHSMGGAVTILYLAAHPDVFRKAAVTSPMFVPCAAGLPAPVASAISLASILCKGRTSRLQKNKSFNPNCRFENSSDAGYHRFVRHIQLRVNDPRYRTRPISSGWSFISLQQNKRLQSRRTVNGIQTPLLLLTAECDRVVHNRPQTRFAARCAACTQQVLIGAKHAVLMGTDDTVTEVVQTVTEFYSI